MKSRMKANRGTLNVFDDLGFSSGEAENLQLRAHLMSKIRTGARDMTRVQAAKLFGVTHCGSMICCTGRSTNSVSIRSSICSALLDCALRYA